MKALLKRLHRLDDDELLAISEAIDHELDRRLQRAERIPESARRRAVQRSQSYRQRNGSAAPPVRVTGMRQSPRNRCELEVHAGSHAND